MRKLIFKFMQSSFFKWVLKYIIPYVRFSTQLPKLNGEAYFASYFQLRPGHIILTVDRKRISTILIPGIFSHAAFCVNVGSGTEVLEMTHTDFTESRFYDLARASDRVVILECMDWTESYIKDMISKAWSFRNAKYDNEFKLGVEALYCSELIYQADFLKTLKVDLSDFAGIGRPYVAPDDLLFAKNVYCTFDSDNILTGLMGADMETVCNAKNT
jgi:hypothetical protein